MRNNGQSAKIIFAIILGILIIVLTMINESGTPKTDYSRVCGWCNGVGKVATGRGYETRNCSHCGGSGHAR